MYSNIRFSFSKLHNWGISILSKIRLIKPIVLLLSVVMLSVFVLSVIMLSTVTLTIAFFPVFLSAIMLIVVMRVVAFLKLLYQVLFC